MFPGEPWADMPYGEEGESGCRRSIVQAVGGIKGVEAGAVKVIEAVAMGSGCAAVLSCCWSADSEWSISVAVFFHELLACLTSR